MHQFKIMILLHVMFHGFNNCFIICLTVLEEHIERKYMLVVFTRILIDKR